MKKPFLSISEAAEFLGVSAQTLRRWHNANIFRATIVTSGKHRLYALTDLELRSKGIVQMAREWVEHEKSALPNSDFYCQTSDVFKARSERMARAMQPENSLKEIWPLVSSIVGEVGNNSFDHNLGNWPDTPGVFFAYDLGKRVVVLADRGRGVLETLHDVRESLRTEADALRVAFTEVLSGRAPENRGNGLKYVSEVVSVYRFPFSFQSGDAIIEMREKEESLHIELAKIPIHGCLFIMKF